MAKLNSRVPRTSDIDQLVSFIPSITGDRLVQEQCDPTIRWYSQGDNAYGFSSLARTVLDRNGNIFGYFSANLITNSAANNLIASKRRFNFYDLKFSPAVGKETLRATNRSDRGSTLFITHWFWDTSRGMQAGWDFLKYALNHTTCWFEGNRINRVLASFYKEFEYLTYIPIHMVSNIDKRKTHVEDDFFALEVTRHDKWPKGMHDWGLRLLKDRQFSPSCKILNEENKIKGRVLHEFGFDLKDAVSSGCIKGWNYNEFEPTGKVQRSEQAKCTGYSNWRREAKKLISNGSHHLDFDDEDVDESSATIRTATAQLKKVLKTNPSVLSLY